MESWDHKLSNYISFVTKLANQGVRNPIAANDKPFSLYILIMTIDKVANICLLQVSKGYFEEKIHIRLHTIDWLSRE